VETVGVGQAETAVADMVDVFVVLMLPGGGDELQGIKKGLIEAADIIAVNKAEGEGRRRAEAAAADYRAALRILSPLSGEWVVPVLTYSALTGEGLEELWTEIERHRMQLWKSGALERRRRAQQVKWMWTMVEERLRALVRETAGLRERLPAIERSVERGATSPRAAADEILSRIGLEVPDL
jgi:LAO/AO transport system kinase